MCLQFTFEFFPFFFVHLTVRQQTSSPLASTPLLQKRHQQKNGSNYWPTDDYSASGVGASTPSYPSSPAVCRSGRVLPLCSDFPGTVLYILLQKYDFRI